MSATFRFDARASTQSAWRIRCDGRPIAWNLDEAEAKDRAADLNAATSNAKIARLAREWAEAKANHRLALLVRPDRKLANKIADAYEAAQAAESALLAAVKESQ